MISKFFVGSAILVLFVLLLIAGTAQLSTLLRRRLQDEAKIAKYWGPALGAWIIIVSLTFGLFSLTDLAQPISKLGPLLAGLGVLAGIKVAISKFKPRTDQD